MEIIFNNSKSCINNSTTNLKIKQHGGGDIWQKVYVQNVA